MTFLSRKYLTLIGLGGITLLLYTMTILREQINNNQFNSYVNDIKDKLNNPRDMVNSLLSINLFNSIEEVPEEITCTVPQLKTLDQFFAYGAKEKYKCDKLKPLGGRGRLRDGAKYVCFDDKYKITPGNCTVLSFGISNDWSFDDAMDKKGCKVYSFDPTIGKEDFNRTKDIHFFNLGLSDHHGIKQIKKLNCQVDRYENILKKLDLTDKVIDYLKMDIEGSEIDFFRDVFNNSTHLLKNIRQIGMEIHPVRIAGIVNEKSMGQKFTPLWHGMHQLECYGFRLAHYEKNPVKNNYYTYKNRVVSQCYEVLWIKE